MKPGAGPLSVEEVGRVAAQLKVKPEDVSEMEMRLAGREVAFEADSDDEEAYAPAQWLAANPEAEPSRVLEAKQNERQEAAGLRLALEALDARSRRIVEARWMEAKGLEKMKKVLQSPTAPRALLAPAA